MENIEKLLNNYFAGSTTLQEEKELKKYFSGKNIDDKYKKYAPLFAAFAQEKEINTPSLRIIKPYQKRNRIILWTSGVAAACLIALLFIHYQPKNESYMIIHGKRINNAEMAENFANEKLQDALSLTKQNLKSLNQNKLIKQKLEELEAQN